MGTTTISSSSLDLSSSSFFAASPCTSSTFSLDFFKTFLGFLTFFGYSSLSKVTFLLSPLARLPSTIGTTTIIIDVRFQVSK
ncbi:hypothetical protein C5167_020259 [Papaver somniferum]|uniref:Uncharacterized protein n=1 Tax=Papaver somniferum TaxID=3469 RepID=A0A4Y7IT24_PAPSO|nr:hypothetical protein C5167_020259 [Papaver somniferum]